MSKPSPKFGWNPEETPSVSVVKDEGDKVAEAFKRLEEAILEVQEIQRRQEELLQMLISLGLMQTPLTPMDPPSPRPPDPMWTWTPYSDGGNWWQAQSSNTNYQMGSLTSGAAPDHSHSHTLSGPQDIRGHSHGDIFAMSYAPTGTNEAMVHSILEGSHKPLTASDESMIEIYSRYTGGN